MGTSDCIFCKMAAGLIPVTKVYEDAMVLAFLDIAPISDGHTLLIPKQHFRHVHDCPGEVLAQMGSHLGKIAKAVAAGMNAEAYNILCNNGRAAGQLVEHLHFHIIPRSAGDGVFQRWPAHKYPEGRMNEVAERVRENL